jgi:hypothetical protein
MVRLHHKAEWFYGLFPFLLVAQLFVFALFVPQALKGWSDFRAFYVGGYMLRAGYAHSFYDQDLQQRLENSLVSQDRLLSAGHPAVEYLLFSPLSYLSYRNAYLAMMVINAGLTALCFHLLSRIIHDRWFLFAVFAGFIPLSIIFASGQDVFLLLLLFCLALRSKSELIAGLFLGLASFRFQFIIPIAIIYLLWRRWYLVLGVALSSISLALANLALIGMDGCIQYVHSLTAMEQTVPVMLPNLRGLSTAVGGGNWLIAVTSIALILWVARKEPSFTTAISASCLLAYHNDMSLLVIPILIEKQLWTWAGMLLTLTPGLGWMAGLPVLCRLFAPQRFI